MIYIQTTESRDAFKVLMKGRMYQDVITRGGFKWPKEHLIKAKKAPEAAHAINLMFKRIAREKALEERSSFAKQKTARELLKLICKKHNITVKEFMSRSRLKKLTPARREFCHTLNQSKAWTLSRIARFLDRDHSTVLYHVKNYRREI